MWRALVWLNLYGREAQKQAKKMHFCVFRLFLSLSRTASLPFRLRCPLHQSILTNPRTNPWNFGEQFLRIGKFENISFFESAILKRKFKNMKISQRFLAIKNGSKFWRLSWFPAKNSQPKHCCPQCMNLQFLPFNFYLSLKIFFEKLQGYKHSNNDFLKAYLIGLLCSKIVKEQLLLTQQKWHTLTLPK